MFIKRSNNTQVGRLRSARRRTFLRVEGLEDRRVPAFLAPIDFATGATTVAAGVGDFNGDGFIDVVSVGNLSGRGVATVELNDGTGHFRASAPSPTGNSPVAVTVGDFDGDGKQDIATLASYYTGGLTVLKGNGDGTFQPPQIYTVQTPPTEFQAEDVNGDGRPDLVAGNHYFNTVSVFLNNGTGAFLPKVDYPGGGSPASVGLADFNGDGKADIGAFGPYGKNGLNRVAIGFLSGRSGDNAFIGGTGVDFGGVADVIVVGDFNGDGIADIGAYGPYGTGGANRIAIGYLDGKNGDVSARPRFIGGFVTDFGGPSDIVSVGDFNGDGKADFGVYGPYGTAGASRYSVGFSNGTPRFTDGIVLELGRPADLALTGSYGRRNARRTNP